MEQIKVGDIVRVSGDAPSIYTAKSIVDWYGTNSVVRCIEGDSADIGNKSDEWFWHMTIPAKYLIKVNAEPKEKPNNTIAIPVEADLTDSFWSAYEADLAKEIALKIANPCNYNERAVAEYAVRVAKSVVENLKEREE